MKQLSLMPRALLVVLGLWFASPAHADEPNRAVEGAREEPEAFFAQGEMALSFLSEVGSYEATAGTAGFGGRVGHRWGD